MLENLLRILVSAIPAFERQGMPVPTFDDEHYEIRWNWSNHRWIVCNAFYSTVGYCAPYGE